MQIVKPVGRQAAAKKYDLLSALGVFALSADRATQTRCLRLLSLITARYNWQRDELCVGQKEIARMWSVDERTVKREMARLRGQGWLVQKTRGARGRISTYGLDLLQIMEDTRPAWPLIGTDFVERVGGVDTTPESPGNVVPLRPAAAAPVSGDGTWARASALLQGEQPGLHSAWLAGLAEVEVRAGILVLAAATSFQKTYIETHYQQVLNAALRRVAPDLYRVELIS